MNFAQWWLTRGPSGLPDCFSIMVTFLWEREGRCVMICRQNEDSDLGRSARRRGGIGLAFVASLTAIVAAGCDQQQTAAGPAAQEDGKLLAFPGAQGHGRFAAGGRGGDIMAVTTLDDSGPGSLRECIEADKPRVCVFRVGGVIRFTTERPIIANPYITIAGETAPGGGILLTHDGGPTGLSPIVIKNTHDVVIRHIRVRMDKMGERRESNSGFIVENSSNIILDHVSSSWTRDENFGGQGENDAITVSWSIFAQGLQPHDKCALLSSDSHKPQQVSFINNLCALNGDRNPDANFPAGSCIEVVNNVLYGATGEFVEVWESNGGTPINIVGNVFRAGEKTPPTIAAVTRWRIETKGAASIYAADNALDGAMAMQTANVEEVKAEAPVCPLTFDPAPSTDVLARVLGGAGAMPRDDFDQRIVSDVLARKGELIAEPGILPALAAGEAPLDDDHDGMADVWERTSGVDDQIANSWEDADGDGWSNLAEYLDFAHRERLAENARM